MPKTHDPYDFFCGDGWYISGYLFDDAGSPLDLTGAAVTWKLDDLSTPPANKITLGIGSGITVLDTVNGIILVEPSAAQTAALTPGMYRDSLRVTPSTSDPYTEWTGIIRAAAAL